MLEEKSQISLKQVSLSVSNNHKYSRTLFVGDVKRMINIGNA